MEIVLVRHGLPFRVDATPGGGPADPGLTERGQQQAERVGAALADEPIDAIYTSPARRAAETAAPVAGQLGRTAVVVPGIAEFDAAEPSYVPVEELRASGDPRWARLVAGDLYSAGVDPAAFRRAVVEAVEGIAARHPGGRVLLVTHSGSINAYAGHVLGQQRALWFAPAYCSISRVAVARTGRTGVLSLNETGHLRGLL